MSGRDTLWDRFWPKVDADGLCWEWTGARIGPYGAVWVDEVTRAGRAHRVAWELLIGPIPDGMTLDHLCRNKGCVNPDHLEVCSAGENARRSPLAPYNQKAQQTHCKRGHPFTPANTAIHHGRRSCRACIAMHGRERRRRSKAKPMRDRYTP